MFFFFKQKTAYEMRISDWSSDVCSSDLPTRPHRGQGVDALVEHHRDGESRDREGKGGEQAADQRADDQHGNAGRRSEQHRRDVIDAGKRPDRSEEHTSELQSLMRISYAVFCLKQKKTIYILNKERH